MNMKHLKRKALVASNVGRAAVATGLSLSMLAGSLVTLPSVSFADTPQSEFSKYAALVKKYAASKDLSPEQIEQLKREVNAAKDDYKESLKSPFKKYAEAVQEYANSGKLNKDQQQALKNHVQQTRKSWNVAKSGDNTPANPGDNTPVNPSASDANSGDTTPANPSAIQRYAQLLEKINSGTLSAEELKSAKAEANELYNDVVKHSHKLSAIQRYAQLLEKINSGTLSAEELKSAKAEANKLYKEIIQGSHNDKPENEDPKDTDKQPSDTDQNNSKQGGKQKGTPKTSDPFGISGILGSVAGLATLGAGFVARKRF
ncbi:hypothetical protein HMPREF0091_10588 [Fannyhessea vaginae DSM 15829]|uniref:Uncharacterized protein n=2 Tax=Fannyhessea vaginae TaxID=82135 RepID=F1T4J7_9ACTN|nr:hypothetical protein HMPREF0091_10588 [Fannyhessea vaginae DSM 15829]